MIKKSVYFDRYAGKEPLFPDFDPPQDLELVVTIPAFKETNLKEAIGSLLSNSQIGFNFLILVLINESVTASEEVIKLNDQAYQDVSELNNPRVLLAREKFVPKKAGVGTARKRAMDEAARWFDAIDRDGIIVCYDADCTCEANYLAAIYNFYKHGNKNSGVVHYAHPTERAGIVEYELFLRYYVNALRYAAFPYAIQTLGSCITVKSSVYQKQGGMNTRKAGEDFYFLNKVIPLGGFGEITDTTVYPSDRLSDRVPFGTGHALNKFNSEEDFKVYNPQAYEDLKQLFDQVQVLYQHRKKEQLSLTPALSAFLDQSEFEESLKKMLGNSTQPLGFKKQFFAWFDGFRVLKFLHFSRDHYYKSVPLTNALTWLNQLVMKWNDFEELPMIDKLNRLRSFDRDHPLSID